VLVGIVLFACLATMMAAREKYTYAELPRTELTATVPDAQFALIKMSPQSAAYVAGLRECLDRFPASRVAVLPDNPGLYPLLGLSNPFSTDWWLPEERTRDHSSKVELTIQRLNGTDGWLVLFQSFGAFTLPRRTLEQVSAAGTPFAYEPTDAGLLSRLNGQDIQCLSFTGKYKPSSK
jgi:hypothetical protein